MYCEERLAGPKVLGLHGGANSGTIARQAAPCRVLRRRGEAPHGQRGAALNVACIAHMPMRARLAAIHFRWGVTAMTGAGRT